MSAKRQIPITQETRPKGPPHPRRAKITAYGWGGQNVAQFFLAWSHKTRSHHLIPTDGDYLNFLEMEADPGVATFDLKTHNLNEQYDLPHICELPNAILRLRGGEFEWRKLVPELPKGKVARDIALEEVASKHRIKIAYVSIEMLAREAPRLRNIARLLRWATAVHKVGCIDQRESILALTHSGRAATISEVLQMLATDQALVMGAIAELILDGTIECQFARHPISGMTMIRTREME